MAIDNVYAMPKRNHAPTPQQACDLGLEVVQNDIDPIDMLNALLATGMTAGEALKAMGEHSPRIAANAFARTLDRFLGDREDVLDVSYANWLTHLPEGLVLPMNSVLDLTGCKNFRSLPKTMEMCAGSTLRLVGSGWDQKVQPPTFNHDHPGFEMESDAVIFYSHGGQVKIFEFEHWIHLEWTNN